MPEADRCADAEMVVRDDRPTAVDNEKYFCDLDAVVGDGDFGYSMARGFEVVLQGWDALRLHRHRNGLLKKVAIVITSRIGGTSGPIWGTAFLRAGAAADGRRSRAAPDQVVAMLRAAIDGIKRAATPTSATRRCSTRSCPRWTRSRPRSLRRGTAALGVRAAASTARERAEATKGDDRQARPGRVHRRAQPRFGRRRARVAVMFEAVSKAWQEAS